jgi:hypothetical protein
VAESHKSAAELGFLFCHHFVQKIENGPKGGHDGHITYFFVHQHGLLSSHSVSQSTCKPQTFIIIINAFVWCLIKAYL